MQFEIVHEFDIPLDAIELAVLSPRLVEQLATRLPDMQVTQKSHELTDGVLRRVLSYAAHVKIPDFARPYVTPEMLSWDEHTTYALKTHDAKWDIVPGVKPEWQKYFQSSGTYSLVPRGDGSARVVRGNLELVVPLVRAVAERLILNEVKKSFEAEAASLRDLATLV